jgi:CBS-domain-containing membrane protein
LAALSLLFLGKTATGGVEVYAAQCLLYDLCQAWLLELCHVSFGRFKMTASKKSLISLTAEDLMSRHLVLLPRQMSLRAAAHLLSKSHVSGAPVVDGDNHCIGVLSATDFVHCVEKGDRAATKRACEPVYYSAWQLVEAESLPTDRVESYMTSDVVTASPSTPIFRLARMMLDAHVHRVVIVNKQRTPIGLVSSTDILAALANSELCGSVQWEAETTTETHLEGPKRMKADAPTKCH